MILVRAPPIYNMRAWMRMHTYIMSVGESPFGAWATMTATELAAAEPVPEYDVAISFLARDQESARAVADQLEASGLSVFFFPRKQEELAVTNGMESIRAPCIGSLGDGVLIKQSRGVHV